MSLNVLLLNKLLDGSGIFVSGAEEHSKASESYIDVKITDSVTGSVWDGRIPYQYRRTGLFLETEQEVADYLKAIKHHFTPEVVRVWIAKELEHWAANSGGDVTPLFFKKLSSLQWVNGDDFPPNPNPQRRLQDIKEMGYTLSTKQVGRKYQRLLVPIPRGTSRGYEVFSPAFRTKALKVLDFLNVYELTNVNRGTLIPDHKFPEIRWDEHTRAENPESMSADEIRQKYQLIDNQRNQQKREACRKCYQSGKRPALFGISYYYKGNEEWPAEVPKVGKAAEAGCVGCGWYDIKAWRDSLNDLVS